MIYTLISLLTKHQCILCHHKKAICYTKLFECLRLLSFCMCSWVTLLVVDYHGHDRAVAWASIRAKLKYAKDLTELVDSLKTKTGSENVSGAQTLF